MISFIQAHSTLVSLAAYWVGSAAVSALPAPTVTSSMFYQWAFKFSNTLAANISRAYSTAVEKSPNFQAAVTIQKQGAPDAT